jgi:hypothetical protein
MGAADKGLIASIHSQLRNRAKATGWNVEDILLSLTETSQWHTMKLV